MTDTKEEIADVLIEMRQQARASKETGVGFWWDEIEDWAKRIMKSYLDLIIFDNRLIMDSHDILKKVMEAIKTGKLAAPGNYPSEESQKFVDGLLHEIESVVANIEKTCKPIGGTDEEQ